MKVIEPISSALLLTGCVYSAGISQNNAFMRSFGVNPEFSQPAIDKIFYDGGLITFEIFYNHIIYAAIILLALTITTSTFILYMALTKGLQSIKRIHPSFLNICTTITPLIPIGTITLLYIIFLCFASYQKGQITGVKLSQKFLEQCYWVEVKDKKDSTKACAFRKDRDSIWYYQLNDGDIKINSKLLTEVGQVTYLQPELNPQ
ncbi:hypothetical protein ACLEJQ_25120 [Pseudomonas sp. SMV71]|uniref:hypothetical protein n=1 Tax=Pseudomonas sp. SMV71 TaxID=3390195 RepID=UPI003F831412